MSAPVSEVLALDELESFLDDHGLGHGPVSATPIGDGASNLSYLIERGGARVVLRRPPPPPLPPSAHDVVREARLVGILDWEMATIGDPLADLGYLVVSWSERGADPHPLLLTPVTQRPGFPARGADRPVCRADWPRHLGARLVPGVRALEGRRVLRGHLQAFPARRAR